MPVTGPPKATAEKSRPKIVAKKDFFRILRTAGVAEETIKATDEQLQDPIDLKRRRISGNSRPGPRPAHEPNGRQPVSAPAPGR
jgi:hypothetical protein